jgi:hypothetical protein
MSFQLLSRTTPKARKEHQCIWCAQPIVNRATYVLDACLCDGDFQSNKWHPECQDAALDEFGYTDFTFDPGEGQRPQLVLTSI